MDIKELEIKIRELGVSEDLYSIMLGGLPNEKLCIVQEEKWIVYYSEKGQKIGTKEFDKEEDACTYFYKKMRKYSLNENVQVIKNLLSQCGFSIVEETEEKIIIVSNIQEDLEYYMLIENLSNEFMIFEINRNSKVLKTRVNEKGKALLISLILLKRMFDDVVNRRAAREIRNLIDDDNEKGALEYFKDYQSLVSVDEEVMGKVSLIRKGSIADVIYNGNDIVTNVKINRAYAVAYNYCSNLQEISDFYETDKEVFIRNGISRREAIEYYMF